ncbi:Calcium/calmodulin-dependent 3',5'-cyclic nucleotide phosphodiesterase 1C [Hypsibius exemplaris]|uniref:Phosphodiesterase n=1 Tax=Hypsibius exemplaris TaxID=2072580 RepID=A0A1W0X1F4_HYPEX|nr:Calcium/calmodulin-dependent 3',5'-cyclic nucleotide phosphodiesterase 1C [Hypsibius exemplaris]
MDHAFRRFKEFVIANAPEKFRPPEATTTTTSATTATSGGGGGGGGSSAATTGAGRNNSTQGSVLINSSAKQPPPGPLKRNSTSTLIRNRKSSAFAQPNGDINGVADLEGGVVDLTLKDVPASDSPEGVQAAVARLRYMIKLIGDGTNLSQLPVDDIKHNLEFAAKVLENCSIEEQRRYNEEDEDELSDVEPHAVPNEVREWLASTFTRKLSVVKRPNEKPKFRSVANAIRAGIFVERIYRRMSSSQVLHIPPKIVLQLRSIDEWTFDVFALNEASNGQALRYVANEVLTRYDLLTKYKISNYAIENYMSAVEAGYSKNNNPYHNLIHAADVTQTMHWFLYQTGLAHWLSDLEIFASLIGAIIHDYEHTGTTNNFHVQSRSNLAMLYNDRSVLENYHLSASFALMLKDEHNILANLTKEEYKEFRSLVIDMVLATDMSIHFQQIKNMKALLSMPENIDKSKALQLVLHSCDISHPSKPWDMHYRWTIGVLEEFFQQGDREQELGLPFSPLCDRQTTVIAQSQIGFIDFIVEPSMSITGDMLEKILKPLRGDDGDDIEPMEVLNQASNDRPKTAPPVRSASEGVNMLAHKNAVWRHTAAKASNDIKKPWVLHFQENKVKWREEGIQADAEKRLKGKPEAIVEDLIDNNIIHEEHEEHSGSASQQFPNR